MPDDLQRRFPLRPGSHRSRAEGMCAMEMVAWLAGEPHGDEPACACPVVGAVVRAFNDLLPDDRARTGYLRPLVPRLVNSRATAAVESSRAFIAADAAVRQVAPRIAETVYRSDLAARLRGLPAVVDAGTARAALALLDLADLRAVRWTAEHAAAGKLAPRLWVTGLVWAARSAGAVRGWPLVRTALGRMLDLRPAGGAAVAPAEPRFGVAGRR